MKNLKFEYLLLPEDGSHLQEFLCRIKDEEGYSPWEINTLPSHLFKTHGKTFTITAFARKYDGYSKVQVYECKITRKKNVRRNKNKSA